MSSGYNKRGGPSRARPVHRYLAKSYLADLCLISIVASADLNFRVRNGNGCIPSDLITSNEPLVKLVSL